MAFDAPLALLGLIAAAVPLIAHLVRQRRLPVVRFGPVRWLLRAAEQNQRRSRLTDLLLLATRTLLVALVALAVAGPRTSCAVSGDPDGRAESLSIVLDDSLSMRRAPGGRSLFEDARSSALRELRGLGPGAQAALVLARAPAFVAVPLTDDLQRVEQAVRSAQPTHRATDLGGAVTAAASELGAARFDARRVLVVTDGARHGAPAGLPEPEAVVLDVRDVAARARRTNRAVADVDVSPDPLRADALVVRARVVAYGGSGGTVSVELVGPRGTLDRASAELSSGASTVTLRAPKAQRAEEARAFVRVTPHDDLPDDDERAVWLRGAGATRVLLVDGDPRPGSPSDELHYARHALSVALPEQTAPTLRTLDADALGPAEIERHDVVVLANVPAPSPSVVDALVRFVESGGGLVVTAGSQVSPNAYTARMSRLLAAGVRGVRDLPGDESEGMVVTPGHLLFSFFMGDDAGLARTRVRRALDVAPIASSGALVAASSPGGSPILVTSVRGEGRLALLATTLDADWTDLPFRPGFLPLLHSIVAYVSPHANEQSGAPVSPGAPVTLRSPPGAARLSIVGPGEIASTLERGRDGRVRLAATERPGAYLVRIESTSGGTRDDLRASFVVAPDPRESDPTVLAGLPGARVTAAARSGSSDPELPIGRWLLALAGLLIVLEGVLRARGRAPAVSARPR
ncbi:MAG: BatA domain-containing protein [Deltaproteobacteria bacterium]|nr:BatA domain-containing protein [Deltaproteobacteria bacterium]